MFPLMSSRISAALCGFAFGNQAGRRADLPWRAIAALECIMVDEGLLQRMQRVASLKVLRW